MQMQDAGIYQPPAHVRNKLTSNLTNLNIVVLDRLQCLSPICRDLAASPVGSAQESGVGMDRHDARNDGYINALSTYFFDPVQENICIVEHLGDDKGRTCVNLLL